MKYIFEFILITIILFFVWNILKRLFFNAFYKNFTNLNSKNQQQDIQQKTNTNKKVHWDAETIDYEEVKDNKD